MWKEVLIRHQVSEPREKGLLPPPGSGLGSPDTKEAWPLPFPRGVTGSGWGPLIKWKPPSSNQAPALIDVGMGSAEGLEKVKCGSGSSEVKDSSCREGPASSPTRGQAGQEEAGPGGGVRIIAGMSADGTVYKTVFELGETQVFFSFLISGYNSLVFLIPPPPSVP